MLELIVSSGGGKWNGPCGNVWIMIKMSLRVVIALVIFLSPWFPSIERHPENDLWQKEKSQLIPLPLSCVHPICVERRTGQLWATVVWSNHTHTSEWVTLYIHSNNTYTLEYRPSSTASSCTAVMSNVWLSTYSVSVCRKCHDGTEVWMEMTE